MQLFGFSLAADPVRRTAMDLTTGMWVGAALFLLLLVPYLVWEIRRARRAVTRGSRGTKSAATAISDLMCGGVPYHETR